MNDYLPFKSNSDSWDVVVPDCDARGGCDRQDILRNRIDGACVRGGRRLTLESAVITWSPLETWYVFSWEED